MQNITKTDIFEFSMARFIRKVVRKRQIKRERYKNNDSNLFLKKTNPLTSFELLHDMIPTRSMWPNYNGGHIVLENSLVPPFNVGVEMGGRGIFFNA